MSLTPIILNGYVYIPAGPANNTATHIVDPNYYNPYSNQNPAYVSGNIGGPTVGGNVGGPTVGGNVGGPTDSTVGGHVATASLTGV